MKPKTQTVKKVLFLMLMLLMNVSAVAHAAPADKYSLYAEGTYYYSKAYEVLDYVNAERSAQGLTSLTMDQQLTEAAMQRAAECAADFSHTRPDGSSCFSVCDKATAENIAAGNSTAQGTFNQWKNSSGHYANMMGANYKSIGIGCFSWGALHYWVQLFSTQEAQAGTIPADRAVKPEISILEGNCGIGFNLNSWIGTLDVGESLLLEPGRANPGWDAVYCGFTGDSFNWTSSNSSVASVNANGLVTAHSVGDAVITAKPKNSSAEGGSITIQCRQSIEDADFSEIAPVTYTGSAHTPDVTVSLNGKKLIKGTDYDINYSNNTDAGRATISIWGRGNYSGSASTSFTIERLDISDKVQYVLRGWNSTGFESGRDCIEAMLDVIYNGKKMECNTDYYISGISSGSNDPNVHSFAVTFTGNYKGTRNFSSLEIGYIKPVITQIYTGHPITPDLKVYISEGWAQYYPNDTLTAGTDYEVLIENNIQPGTAQITITGIGQYYGTLKGSFKIVKPVTDNTSTDTPATDNPGNNTGNGTPAPATPGNNTDNGTPAPATPGNNTDNGTPVPATPGNGNSTAEKQFTAKVQKTALTYNGKAQKPAVTVKDGTITLKEGTDYTLKYSSNKQIGTAKVIVCGKGAYTNFTKTLTFKILPKKTTGVKVSPGKKRTLTVKWKKDTKVTGYQIQVAASTKFKSGVKNYTVKRKTVTKYTCKKLKAKKTYYVRVRAYKKIGKKTYYGSWSTVRRAKL